MASKKLTNSHSIWPHVLPGLRAQSGKLSLAVLCLLGGILLRIVEPWPLQYVVDHLIVPIQAGSEAQTEVQQVGAKEAWSDEFVLAIAAVALLALASLRALAEYSTAIIFSIIGNRVVADLRGRVYGHLQSLPLSFHQASRSGDLTLRIVSDMNLLKDVAVTAVLPLVASGLLLVGMFSYMIYLNWKLGLLVASVYPAFCLLARYKSKKIHQAAKKQRQREGALAATAAESIAAVKSVQAHGAHSHFANAFAAQNNLSLKDGVKTGRLTAGLERSVDIMIACASAAVLWQGTRYVMDGSFTAGGLIVYLTYLKRGFKPLQDFAKFTGRLSKAMAASDRVTDVLSQTPAVVDAHDATDAPSLTGEIRFENMSFGYRQEQSVIRNLNAHILAGQSVAVVGPSGIGKSTLLSLLMRLQEQGAGRILMDGTDIRQWKLDTLRRQIGIVLQENVVFAGTIRDNIAFGASEVSDDEIQLAAKVANCAEFIGSLDGGIYASVGERGANLSQGQRQRLVLARSVVRCTPILLLDEPTANLDPVSSGAVTKAILNASVGRTTLVVTHDMELAMRLDRVLFIDSSRNGHFASPNELRERCPEFNAFVGLDCHENGLEVKHAVQC